jgi:acyl-CoA thioester hydrolase
MEFAFETDLAVRYRDLDPLEHVNNASHVTYLGQARIEYLERVLDVPLREIDIVLANINVDFLREVGFDDGSVTVACGVAELSESSFRMEYVVTPAGADDPAVTAETTTVVVDGDGGTAPIPPSWRECFEAFEPGL